MNAIVFTLDAQREKPVIPSHCIQDMAVGSMVIAGFLDDGVVAVLMIAPGVDQCNQFYAIKRSRAAEGA
ncbi:hypothetical protein ACWGQ2_18275 [Arthrobacter sp. NPDC055585]